MVVDYHGPRYQTKSLLLQFHILIIVFSIKRFVFSLNLELSIAIFSSVINIHLLKITYLLITKEDISQYKIVMESEFSIKNSINIYYIYIKEIILIMKLCSIWFTTPIALVWVCWLQKMTNNMITINQNQSFNFYSSPLWISNEQYDLDLSFAQFSRYMIINT